MSIKNNVTFVVTTINEPTFLAGYAENARKFGHDPNVVDFVVVGDLRSPISTKAYCSDLTDEYGYQIEVMDVDRQIEWLRDRGLDGLERALSYNSLQRRNVGFLRAYERGTDVVVTLDDDNLAGSNDVVGAYQTVGTVQEMRVVTTSNGWYNPCSLLDYDSASSNEIYHRGFPYSKRDETDVEYTTVRRPLTVRAGLWTDVPDVDVITHLDRSPQSEGLRGCAPELTALAEGVLAPFNTQNVGFDADALPLFFALPMGDEINGMTLRRFDDIWMGYFAEQVLHARGEAVAYGTPMARHDRNTHRLLQELEHEAIGLQLTEVLLDLLKDISVTQSGEYLTGYRDLTSKLRARTAAADIDYDFAAYLNRMCDRMDAWSDACNAVM